MTPLSDDHQQEDGTMVTIVTDVHLKEGSEQNWDAAMRERMAAAKKQHGWVGGQMLEPEADPMRRVIIGTWQTRDDREYWHEDLEIAATPAEPGGPGMKPTSPKSNDVVLHQ